MEKRGFIIIGSIFPACDSFWWRSGEDRDSKAYLEVGGGLRFGCRSADLVRSEPVSLPFLRLVISGVHLCPASVGMAGLVHSPDVRHVLWPGAPLGGLPETAEAQSVHAQSPQRNRDRLH